MSKSAVILCVDDEPQILEALTPVLARKYLVKTAPSGSVALDILRISPAVTVIISDMRMPSMNGAQFLSASRQIVPHARRILLTGHADIPTALAAVNEGGICRLLTKPCPVEEIVEVIEEAIAEYDTEVCERTAIRRIAERDALSRDALTGLLSRKSLLEHLDSCREQRPTAECATEIMFCIEIANIEELSDSYGSGTTNQAMHIVVARLRGLLCFAKCLGQYRLETVVALIDLQEPSEAAAEALARRVIRVLEQPIEVDGIALQFRVRVGWTRIAIGSDDPSVVLRYAELAAREAAQPGRDSVCFYSQESRAKVDLRHQTIRALRDAITHEQLHLHYQPIVDLEHGSLYSIEALARWTDSRLGVVSPNTFIPLAEQTDLMIPLGEWVLNRACADAKASFGSIFRRLSVNVSITQLLHPRFIHGLSQCLEKSELEFAALELEVTETVFAGDLEKVCDVLSKARDLGISVAIDDFGAGYSSLAYLSRLPVDTLKIDAVFVRDFNHGGEAIIGAALAVAKTLKIDVIVEGIETADSLDKIRGLGATKAQGYLFARPMPATMLGSWHSEFLKLSARHQGLMRVSGDSEGDQS
jgi:EAL domain-containing protein (putative c-di-GMP-specific phosphodiesterase class I)/PleD family two-component response regulator